MKSIPEHASDERENSRLTAYLMGELSEGEIARLESDLKSNSHLKQQLTSLKETSEWLRSAAKEGWLSKNLSSDDLKLSEERRAALYVMFKSQSDPKTLTSIFKSRTEWISPAMSSWLIRFGAPLAACLVVSVATVAVIAPLSLQSRFQSATARSNALPDTGSSYEIYIEEFAMGENPSPDTPNFYPAEVEESSRGESPFDNGRGGEWFGLVPDSSRSVWLDDGITASTASDLAADLQSDFFDQQSNSPTPPDQLDLYSLNGASDFLAAQTRGGVEASSAVDRFGMTVAAPEEIQDRIQHFYAGAEFDSSLNSLSSEIKESVALEESELSEPYSPGAIGFGGGGGLGGAAEGMAASGVDRGFGGMAARSAGRAGGDYSNNKTEEQSNDLYWGLNSTDKNAPSSKDASINSDQNEVAFSARGLALGKSVSEMENLFEESQVPNLGDTPITGRLFANNKSSELSRDTVERQLARKQTPPANELDGAAPRLNFRMLGEAPKSDTTREALSRGRSSDLNSDSGNKSLTSFSTATLADLPALDFVDPSRVEAPLSQSRSSNLGLVSESRRRGLAAMPASDSDMDSERYDAVAPQTSEEQDVKLSRFSKKIESDRLELKLMTAPAPSRQPATVTASATGSVEKRKSSPAPTRDFQEEALAESNPFSTFSLQVRDVSFKSALAAFQNGAWPAPETMRSEEFLNAFDYGMPEPDLNSKVALHHELSAFPFEHQRLALRISLKTAALGREASRPLNLVAVLDNSGSMERPDRNTITRGAFEQLANSLNPQDKLSVIAFSRQPRLWMEGLPGGDPLSILTRLGELNPEGGTNLEAALDLAYEVAQRNFIPEGENRVVLMTDGAANLGQVNPELLAEQVMDNRRQGIALDTYGIGWDGLNDPLLERLSRNGDGRYAFLNDPLTAPEEFANELAGALQVAAKQVKIQLEWNPDRVQSFRLIGYSKNRLTAEQFRDNSVDAGELAAREAGSAIYTLELKPNGVGPVAIARARYQDPETQAFEEKSWTIPYTDPPALEASSTSHQLAVVSALFGERLSNAPRADQYPLTDLMNTLQNIKSSFSFNPRVAELEFMLQQAQALSNIQP